jgi:choline dehydrogenase
MKKGKSRCYEADIIVVGGGAAGCILMNQLSAKGRFSVLGLEAGANLTSDPQIEAIGLPAFLLPGTAPEKYFWSGWKQTKPMAGLNGRVSDWTTGLLLGGGSSINGLYYGRGSNSMYSRWEPISKSSNWSLSKILSTFKRLETYQGLTITPLTRGDKGPVDILQTPTVAQLTSQILLPATQVAFPGIPVVQDYNDSTVQNCIDPRAQWFIQDSTRRVSSATAFLGKKVMTPKGFGVNGHTLRVLFKCVVLKINFEKKRASAVQFLQDGRLVEARARVAIVLAAGINSSKLLQLSGIGPSATLSESRIKPVFINENVGKHLQNHPTLFISLLANPADVGIPPGAPYAFTIHNVYLPVVGGQASDPRMLQILFEYVPAGVGGSPVPLLVVGFDLLNPKSEGSTLIQSNNSFQISAVDDAFYKDPIDLQNVKDAIKVYIRALLEQLALLSPAPFYRPIPTDPFNVVTLFNYNDLVVEQYVKNNTNLSLDIHHFVSHCKMAPLSEGGVVDGNTRVHGTTNLYVADNAICPVIPDINTTGSAMMIGLRTSDILKRKLRKSKSGMLSQLKDFLPCSV